MPEHPGKPAMVEPESAMVTFVDCVELGGVTSRVG